MRGERVTQRMGMQVPIDVGDTHVFLDDAPDRALRQPPPGIIEEDRFSVRVSPATPPIRLFQELLAHRPVFFKGFLGLGPVGNDAFLAAFASDAENAFFLFHVGKIEAGEFADAQSSGIKKFEERPVAAKQQAFSGSPLLAWQIRGGRGCHPFFGTHPARSRLSDPAKLIEKTVHLFGREHRRDALRQLGRWNQTRRTLLQMAFADAILEERTQSRKLPGDRTLPKAAVVEMRYEFANHRVRNSSESGRPGSGRREIRDKLFEVPAIVQNRMRRGILHRLKVLKILRNRLNHSQPQLRGKRPEYSIDAHKSAESKITGLFLRCSWSGLCRHGHRSFFRLRLRLSFGNQLLPIAAFLEAGVDGADLGPLLDDERRAALRARLGDGHVRGSEIAIRITGTTVENTRASAAAFAGAAAADEFPFVALRAFDAHGDRPRVLALRIAGASDELAEAAVHFSSSGSSGWCAMRVP